MIVLLKVYTVDGFILILMMFVKDISVWMWLCSYIFGVILFRIPDLFRIPGQTRNPEFRPEFPVTNFPEQNRTGIPENSIFRRRISGCPDIRLNPSFCFKVFS